MGVAVGVRVGKGVGVSEAGMTVTTGGGRVEVGVAGAGVQADKITNKEGIHFFIDTPAPRPTLLQP